MVPYYERVDARYLQNQENREEVGQYHLLGSDDVDRYVLLTSAFWLLFGVKCEEEEMERKVTRLS